MNFLFRTVQFGFLHIWPALALIFAARELPPEDLGILALLLSVATLFRPLVGFSIGRVAIRFSGEARSRDGAAQGQAVLVLALRLGFLASLAGLFGIYLAMVAVDEFYEMDGGSRTLVHAIAFAYFFGLVEFLDGIFRASNAFRSLAIAVITSRLLGIMLFAFVLPFMPTLEHLFLFMAAAEVLCVTILLLYIFLMFRHAPRPALSISVPISREMLRYCLPVVINALSVYFYARAMVLIAGLYDTSANIGSFEIAVQLTYLPTAVTIICASVLSPAVSRLVAQGSEGLSAASTLVSQGAAFSVWVNVVVATWLTVVAPFAMQWAFPHLPLAAVVLAILSPLVAIKAFVQIISGDIAVATGAAGTAARITLGFAVVTVVLGFLLARDGGVVGAAVAMAVAHTGAVAVSVVVLVRKTGLTLRYRGAASLITAALAGAPTLATVLYLRDSPPLATVLGTLVFVGVLAGVVALAAWRKLALIEPLRDGRRMLRNKEAGRQA
jgi:O-antigen/teichoic acid export membrane protein